jgi:hypothetical protein
VTGGLMQIYEYKGYIIYPTPHFLVCSKEWKIAIVIKYDNTIKKFSNNKIFSTEAEAVFNSIQFGKLLIDQGIVSLGVAV